MKTKTLAAALCIFALSSAPVLADPLASFDVMGTGMPPGITSNSPGDLSTHIGMAIGMRIGRRVALMPLANVIPKDESGHATIRPGIALVTSLGRHLDLGIAEISRPQALSGGTAWAPAVVVGFRL